MLLTQLKLTDFRGFAQLEWQPGPAINLITGDNGAGKTSLLEALHLVAHGRSFRARVGDGLIRRGQPHLELVLSWQRQGRQHQAGLRHSGREWQARLDREDVVALSELCAALAVISYEPGSQSLISGGAELRRRFLDWALFHVEPDFLGQWRRYARALRQRNQLLKEQAATVDLLASWESEMASAGERLCALRRAGMEQLNPRIAKLAASFLPELGAPSTSFLPGWNQGRWSLAEALEQTRHRDLHLGYSSLGPHRADWRIEFPGLDSRAMLSRGQTKLLALCCVLAQAQLLTATLGEPPILCLDDLASELDGSHLARVVAHLADTGAQIFITGTRWPQPECWQNLDPARFHVEHGQVVSCPDRSAT